MRAVRVIGRLSFVGVAAAFGLASAASASAPTPAALYHALLTTPIPDSQLPSGYHSAKVGTTSPSSNAQKYHVIGEVEVDGGGGLLLYVVFPNHQDALADYRHSEPTGKITGRLAAPRSFPKPSKILNGSITGKNALGKTVTNGITAVSLVDGNVAVGAATISTTNTDSGDVPGAIRLAQLALKHLHAVRGH